MLRSSLLILTLGLSLTSAAFADVYKYKDANGKVVYTDRPEYLPAERLSIQSQRTDVVELDKEVDEDNKAMADRDKARKDADKAKADQKKAAEISASSKAEACNKARQDYLNRMTSQRLFEEQANGERRYLDDKEIDAARAAAKQAMDTLCN